MLEGLVYVSAPAPGLEADDIVDILETSRRNNAATDITGLLLFSPNMFVQVLEGPKEALDKTIEKIRTDIRHSGVTILSRSQIEGRFFQDWLMAFRDLSPDEGERLQAETGFGDAQAKLGMVPRSYSLGLLITSIRDVIQDFH